MRLAFNTNLDHESKLFALAFDKFCIIKVIKIIHIKSEKSNNLQFVLDQIWKMKIFRLYIIQSIPFSKLAFKFSKIKNINIKISNKKNLSLSLYRKIFQIKNAKFLPAMVDNKNKILLLTKTKTVILPKNQDIEKYKRIYQGQVKSIEQQIILYDMLHYAYKKYKIKINPLIKNYIK